MTSNIFLSNCCSFTSPVANSLIAVDLLEWFLIFLSYTSEPFIVFFPTNTLSHHLTVSFFPSRFGLKNSRCKVILSPRFDINLRKRFTGQLCFSQLEINYLLLVQLLESPWHVFFSEHRIIFNAIYLRVFVVYLKKFSKQSPAYSPRSANSRAVKW